MKFKNISRRKFLKNTAVAGAAISLPASWMCSSGRSHFDTKGLPTRMLGKTGVKVPLLTIGTGSRFMTNNRDKRLEILEYALDHGLYYWDTAAIYKKQDSDEYSEQQLGELLKDRRKEVFLATKVSDRDPEQAKKTIEQSLQRLQTDYIDLYQVHSVDSVDDIKNLTGPGGVLDLLHQYRSEGVIGHIGFSGHKSGEGMKYAAENFDFDTMLIAMNHWVQWDESPEKQAIPTAAEKGMGIIAMKVVRPKDTIEGLDVDKLLRYALSLEGISTAVVGIDSIEVLQKNIETITDFKPLDEDEMESMRLALTPYYQHKNLEWMQPGYRDGFA